VSAQEVVQLVERTLGRRGVRLEDRLAEDLGAESMDVLLVVTALEEDFGIEIGEAEISDLRRVSDLVARVERDAT